MIRNVAFLLHRGVKIGYISDVHTEFLKYPKFIQHIGHRKCDVLVLAGDIGDPFSHDNSYKKFLDACTGISKHTLVLAGNHEYYQGNRYSMSQTKTKIASVCEIINASNQSNQCNYGRLNIDEDSSNYRGDIHFMDNSVFTYRQPNTQHDIRFICTTLWSDIDKDHETNIYRCINDYNQIMGFTPSLSRKLYKRSCDFINESLLQKPSHDIHTTNIVVTHHAPTTYNVSAPQYMDSPFKSAFSSDYQYARSVKPPHAWIFGHTHFNVARFDTKLNTILLSNQVGYSGEDCGMICDWENKVK